MICIDNSEWMRNGDYSPTRFEAQKDAVSLICGAKTQVFLFFLFLSSWVFFWVIDIKYVFLMLIGIVFFCFKLIWRGVLFGLILYVIGLC